MLSEVFDKLMQSNLVTLCAHDLFTLTSIDILSNKSQCNQWLNSVINWLINHWTNWVQTGLTSLDSYFDSLDIIYHIIL